MEELHDAISAELLDRVPSMDPTDFERLVIRLMRAMGYGGASSDAARHLGRTGDNGVDGVIDEDRLGLDQVYIQAKRWPADHAVMTMRPLPSTWRNGVSRSSRTTY